MKYIFLITLFLSTLASADTSDFLIRVSGRDESVVTRSEIRLSDLADVEAMKPGQDDTIIGIKNVIVGNLIKPGESTSITASDILSRLQDEGFSLTRIGYTFPKSLNVRRAARTLSQDEILNAIKNYLDTSGKDASIQALSIPKPIMVSPGEIKLTPRLIPTTSKGMMHFDVNVSVNGDNEGAFQVAGASEQWATIPVAATRVEKGSVLDSSSVQMARVNYDSLPLDAEDTTEALIGKKVTQTIEPGIPFRKSYLARPVVVTKGSKVILKYSKGALQATASGTALSDGSQGSEIKIKNDSSQRIVSGWVVEPGLVSVTFPTEGDRK